MTISLLINSLCGDPGYTSCHVAIWIRRVVPYILLCLGTIGNVLSLIIFSRKALRHRSTTIYLGCLALSDLTFLWTAPIRNSITIVKQVDIVNINILFCKMQSYTSHTSACFSVWLLVLLTKERILFTAFPVMARRKMTRTYAKVAAATTFVCSVLLNFHYVIGNELRWKMPETVNSTKTNTTNDLPWTTSAMMNWTNANISKATTAAQQICEPSTAEYNTFITEKWNTILIMTVNIIPFLLIASGNAVIALLLWRQNRRVATPNTHRSKGQNSVTKLLLSLSLYFSWSVPRHILYLRLYTRLTKVQWMKPNLRYIS